MSIYVGIDVHKRFCHAALMNQDGIILHELKFENTIEGAHRLVNLARSVNPHVKAVLEPSANYWIKIYDKLEDEGVEVKLSNPSRTKDIAEARVKMDKIDAKILAYLLRGDLVAESYVPTKKNRQRRSLIRHRASLMRMRTEIKNRIHNLLDKYDLKPTCTGLFCKKGVEWLRSLQLEPIDKTILDSDLQLLDALDAQVEKINLEIASIAVDQENVKLLMTLPGIDYYAAMVIASEIGDVTRFPDAKNLVSWTGLAPSLRQSGSRIKRGRITKQGSRTLRWILIQATHNACRNDERLRSLFERVARRRGENKATVAVAREMLVIAYHMLKRKEPYRGVDDDLYRSKLKRLERLGNNRLHE